MELTLVGISCSLDNYKSTKNDGKENHELLTWKVVKCATLPSTVQLPNFLKLHKFSN